jgi:hypothetical protein
VQVRVLVVPVLAFLVWVHVYAGPLRGAPPLAETS